MSHPNVIGDGLVRDTQDFEPIKAHDARCVLWCLVKWEYNVSPEDTAKMLFPLYPAVIKHAEAAVIRDRGLLNRWPLWDAQRQTKLVRAVLSRYEAEARKFVPEL